MTKEARSPDRLAVVTGGASGIGLAIVHQLLSQNWAVVAVDADRAALDRLEGEMPGASGRLRSAWLDITNEEGVAALFDDLARTSSATPLRGLVNSAGIGKSMPFLQTDTATFRKTVEVNLVGTFLMGQAAARRMAACGGGAIVNISSGSVPQGRYGRAEDVAKAVVFLLDGDQSAYITGDTLCVDGGFYAAGSFTRAGN